MAKKFLCLLLALACVMSMVLVGCGKTDNPAGSTSSTSTTTYSDETGTTETDSSESTTGSGSQNGTQTTTGSNTGPHAGTSTSTSTSTTTSGTTKGSNSGSSGSGGSSSGKDAWKDDGVLKILTIGNSFSVDCMQFVYNIAKAAGIQKIKLGNLYISGCSLETHLNNAKSDAKAYTFYTNNSGTWVTNSNYKLSAGVKSDNWDFVSFQQASGSSGKADTYATMDQLLPIVEGYCTNANVEFMWHMTWAYQGNSTHSSFKDYNKNQMTMYNAIVNAVKTKIVPNKKITRIVPNGTAVQNARTSYLGDTLTRDGYHMSKDKGRVLVGITMVATTVGIPWDTINLSGVCSDKNFVKVALESAKNAVANPFAVTQSAIKEIENSDNIGNINVNIDMTKYDKLTLTLNKNQYWNSSNGTSLTSGTNTAAKYFATGKFTKETLPVGSIILVADGWKYRPDAWKGTASTSNRPAEVTTQMVTVTDAWWGNWTTRAFNIARTDGGTLTNYTSNQIDKVFQIYIPKK